MVIRGGLDLGLEKVKYFAPHDIMGKEYLSTYLKIKIVKLFLTLWSVLKIFLNQMR